MVHGLIMKHGMGLGWNGTGTKIFAYSDDENPVPMWNDYIGLINLDSTIGVEFY